MKSVLVAALFVFVAGAASAQNIAGGCAGASPAVTKTVPFSNAASASNLLLVAGTSGQNIYICHIKINPAAGAVNESIVEGTTTTNPCDTGTAGVDGGATANTGANFGSNGGETDGNGMGIIARTATAGDNMCMVFSGAVQVSGVITYAKY